MSKDNELEAIKHALNEMFQADTKAGVGWYMDADWRKAYGKLQRLSGYKKATAVFDANDNLDNEVI